LHGAAEPGPEASDTSRGSICDLFDDKSNREASGRRGEGIVSRRFTTNRAKRRAVRLPRWVMAMEAWFAAPDPALAAICSRTGRETRPYCADITLSRAFVGRARRGAAPRLPYHCSTHRDDLGPGPRVDALKKDRSRLPRGICSPTQRPWSAGLGPRPARTNRGRSFSGASVALWITTCQSWPMPPTVVGKPEPSQRKPVETEVRTASEALGRRRRPDSWSAHAKPR
jgi:hypothetical protein